MHTTLCRLLFLCVEALLPRISEVAPVHVSRHAPRCALNWLNIQQAQRLSGNLDREFFACGAGGGVWVAAETAKMGSKSGALRHVLA